MNNGTPTTPLPSPKWELSPDAGHRSQRATTGGTTLPVGSAPLLATQGLEKSYHKNKIRIPVLRGVDLEIHDGDFTAIVGQSGSGKSTLLHLLASLDAPDAGTIHFEGRRIDNISPRQRDRLRSGSLGMIFQFYHLLPELTTLENTLLPMMIANSVVGYWRRGKAIQDQAKYWLDKVGLSHRLKHRPQELSGGEMQRVAMARALVNSPRVLLADEPTGNLDQQTGGEIVGILRSLNQNEKLTIVMVTHDMVLATEANRLVRLVNGRVIESRG